MVKRGNIKRHNLVQLLLAIAIILLLNVIASFLFQRFDLTAEKRYSLSPASKKLAQSLDDVIYVKVYLEGEFPAGFKRLRNETKEMLDEFRAYANDNIEYEFIDPSEAPDEATRKEIYKQLVKQGLQPTNLQVKQEDGTSEKIIFPGAVFSYKGREISLQLLKSQMGASPDQMLNNSVQALEYEISNVIRKLSIDIKPKIAFIEGHGELREQNVADISRALSEYYNVERIRINEKLNSLDGIEAIVIAKPDSAFSDKDLFILDQFVMRGGKILWLIDPVFASMDSLQKSNVTMGIPISQRLEIQLFKYGVRINTNLIQDIQSAPIPVVTGYVGNQPQQQFFPWYYFPLIIPTENHPIVKNLNAIKLEFASTIDTIEAKGIKKTILLATSKYTKVQTTPARISLGIMRVEPEQKQFDKSYQPVAVLLEGKFESAFKNVPIDPSYASSKDANIKYQSKETKMIVISDGDVIKNYVQASTGNIYPLGYDRYTDQLYGNKNFILNAVNYLCDDSGLISVRSRELTLRMLDKTKLKKEKLKWQLINVLVPFLAIVLFGFTLRLYRKRKFVH